MNAPMDGTDVVKSVCMPCFMVCGMFAHVKDGDMVVVETRRSAIRVKATTTEDMMPGGIALAHGWEEGVNANLLTELDDRDPVTGYSEFRNLACRIRREKGR